MQGYHRDAKLDLKAAEDLEDQVRWRYHFGDEDSFFCTIFQLVKAELEMLPLGL